MARDVVIQFPVLEKILRTVIVYAVIVLLFRVAGKRGLANLNTLDLTVLLLLSNVVQNAIIGNDDSLTGGVVGAVTLVAVNAGLNHGLARSNRLAQVLVGTATTVICPVQSSSKAFATRWKQPSSREHRRESKQQARIRPLARGAGQSVPPSMTCSGRSEARTTCC